MNQVYAIHVPQYRQNFSVVHLEMLNIWWLLGFGEKLEKSTYFNKM